MSSIRGGGYSGPIKAVILDWAGTTVDYGCRGPVAAFIEVFNRRNVNVSLEETRAPMGLMKKDHLRAMCRMDSVSAKWRDRHGRLPEERDVEAMFRDLEHLMVSSIATYSDPIPGAIAAVADLHRRRIKVGSTAGYTRPIMDILVRTAGERGYHPDAVVCPSDVPEGRPSPFMCYLNAIRLEVYPMQAIVKVGDTVADMEEAFHAGMWSVGVTKTGSELGLSETEVLHTNPQVLKWKVAAAGKKLLEAGAHEVIEGIWEIGGMIDEFNRRLAAGEHPSF